MCCCCLRRARKPELQCWSWCKPGAIQPISPTLQRAIGIVQSMKELEYFICVSRFHRHYTGITAALFLFFHHFFFFFLNLRFFCLVTRIRGRTQKQGFLSLRPDTLPFFAEVLEKPTCRVHMWALSLGCIAYDTSFVATSLVALERFPRTCEVLPRFGVWSGLRKPT